MNPKRSIEKYFNRAIPNFINIAIDGPAASGKSTTAKIIANKVGLLYIDTGAMYRAFTLQTIKREIDLSDSEQIQNSLEQTRVELKQGPQGLIVLLDDEDVSEAIRLPEVSSSVSEVSALAPVRKKMAALQREMGISQDSILDGRDIGTTVLPDAFLKIYMVCSIEARAQRRWRELTNKNVKVSLEEIIKDIESRDYIDSHRKVSPLRKAEDALEIDTSHLTIEEQVDEIIKLLRKKVEEK